MKKMKIRMHLLVLLQQRNEGNKVKLFSTVIHNNKIFIHGKTSEKSSTVH